MGRESERDLPLFETKSAKGTAIYRVFAASIFVGICLIWIYRARNIPEAGEDGRWAWIGLFAAELWFSFYWILTQSVRWKRVYRQTFKDRLSQRYEKELPGVDVFVCTADPALEPPLMVINTVLSVMAYDYPTEKLSVYLSDDAGSELTFYALMEAAQFSKHWIPFCKKFHVQTRSPPAFFRSNSDNIQSNYQNDELGFIKALYEEMESRIESATKLGRISDNIRSKYEGFNEWKSYTSPRDHSTILRILIDARDQSAVDIEGNILPTLVYLAREKQPQHHHNFKAGAMNALIRVSSEISNGQVILNVDCDMYSNSPDSVRDALCFFLDEQKGQEIAFVQFPQSFDNLKKNDIYGASMVVVKEVEFPGLDGYGGPLYIGTGCFHRRESLCGRKFSEVDKVGMESSCRNTEDSVQDLEEKAKPLASCTFDQNTEWGKEKGLRYGCPVEDVITGLSIQCQGWKSAYYNPKREAFLGVAPTTLPQTLVQHKRWSEGDFQILLSRYSPAWFAHGKISLGQQLGYCCYCLWAPNCLAGLYFSIVPSLYLLKSTPLFPQISSLWFIPFGYVVIAVNVYSFGEFLWSGGTVLGWWNEQRMWLYKRTSSYLFGLLDTLLRTLGFSQSTFVITAKVADEELSSRYDREIMEFGAASPMFTILTTLSLLNLLCFAGFARAAAIDGRLGVTSEKMGLQVFLCGVLVVVNFPLYRGLFFRMDKGKLPSSVAVKSTAFALSALCSFSLAHFIKQLVKFLMYAIFVNDLPLM